MLSKSSSEKYPQGDRKFSGQIPLIKSPSLNGLRVLVVDDNDDCLYIVKFVLEDCQAQTKTVTSVDEAIEAIEEWKPDVEQRRKTTHKGWGFNQGSEGARELSPTRSELIGFNPLNCPVQL